MILLSIMYSVVLVSCHNTPGSGNKQSVFVLPCLGKSSTVEVEVTEATALQGRVGSPIAGVPPAADEKRTFYLLGRTYLMGI